MPPSTPCHDARFWIDHLNMQPHPEGGWFCENYRSPDMIPAAALPARYQGKRCCGTAIYFLLRQGEFSALHRLASDELWFFHDGAPLTVHVISPAGDGNEISLGQFPLSGQCLQAVIPSGCWFGAETQGDYSLVSCAVSPGFEFSDFELGRRDALLSLFPRHAGLINRLTRT